MVRELAKQIYIRRGFLLHYGISYTKYVELTIYVECGGYYISKGPRSESVKVGAHLEGRRVEACSPHLGTASTYSGTQFVWLHLLRV